VAVVAVPDALLGESVAKLSEEFPLCEFRAVGVTLGRGDYLAQLAAATEALDVRLVFSNAGYMATGLFDDADWARHEANIGCNATSHAAVAHLFVRRMRAARARGAVAFTSSPASCLPSPFACLYGSTKAFVSQFAASLAGELRQDGIDVCVLHPSPVATRFYDKAHAMPTLQMFQATATGPEGVAEALIRGLGRSVIVDHGYYSLAMRLLQRVADVAGRDPERVGVLLMQDLPVVELPAIGLDVGESRGHGHSGTGKTGRVARVTDRPRPV
jgi:short-subunit dehydrogenase